MTSRRTDVRDKEASANAEPAKACTLPRMANVHAGHLVHSPEFPLIKLGLSKPGLEVVTFDDQHGNRNVVQRIVGGSPEVLAKRIVALKNLLSSLRGFRFEK